MGFLKKLSLNQPSHLRWESSWYCPCIVLMNYMCIYIYTPFLLVASRLTPKKKMSSATNIGTSPMINTYITLNNPSKTSGWSLKTLYPPGNMPGNNNYRRFSRSLHLWGMFRPAQLWVWPHRKPCMNQSWLVKQVTWRDSYSTVHTCPGSLTYSNHFVKQYIVHLHQSHFLSVVTFFSAVLLSWEVVRRINLRLCPYNSPSNLRSWFQSSSGNRSKFQTHLCPLSTFP